MERVSLSTSDLTRENIDKIAALFPDVVTEIIGGGGEPRRVIDFDALRDDLSGEVVEGPRERYQFTWPGKRAAKLEARTPCDKTMRPEREKSVDWDSTQNLYIEGDNLEALKLLRETYAGKVKLIYIDPPYNTGHDFIYDDDFSQTKADYDAESGDYDEEGGRLVANPESNGRFHSDWCSMMYPRLLLARDLLSSDGVIAVSIDDSEMVNLKKLMDEVYGDGSFVANAIWQKRTSPEMRRRFSAGHEYIVVYTKTTNSMDKAIGLLPLSDDDRKNYSNPDNDPRGPWASSDFTAQGFRPNQMYEITTPGGTKYTPPSGTCWKVIESEYERQAAEGRFWYGKDGCSMPRRKTYLAERQGKNVWTWWPNKEVGHTQEATQELNRLFPEAKVFDFSKPVRLVQRVISIGSNDDSLVLDFFSGSATTAHAVMKLNAEDGGSRKFIMVQLPEKCDEKSEAAKAGYHTICDVGEERIRRAAVKIREEVDAANAQLKLGEKPKPVPDLGFRVLRIDSSNYRDTRVEPGEQDQAQLLGLVDNLKEDRTPEDLLFQVLPAFRIPYSAQVETFDADGATCFNVNGGRLVACFDADVSAEAIERVARMRPRSAVFRDASLADDATVANFEELFRTYSPDTVRRVI